MVLSEKKETEIAPSHTTNEWCCSFSLTVNKQQRKFQQQQTLFIYILHAILCLAQCLPFIFPFFLDYFYPLCLGSVFKETFSCLATFLRYHVAVYFVFVIAGAICCCHFFFFLFVVFGFFVGGEESIQAHGKCCN